MPYEISMCGGGPWGFRMGGGAFTGKPLTVSRITPGGKAAQANVMQGDVLTAVNGMKISDLQLPEVMQLIKESGEEVHLTLLTQEEASITVGKKRQSEANITTAAERERPLNPQSPLPPRFTIRFSCKNGNESKNKALNNNAKVTNETTKLSDDAINDEVESTEYPKRFKVTPRSTPEPPKRNGVAPSYCPSPLAMAPKPFIPNQPIPAPQPAISPVPKCTLAPAPASTSVTPLQSPVASPSRPCNASAPSPVPPMSPSRNMIKELEAMPTKAKPQPPVPKPRRPAPVEEEQSQHEQPIHKSDIMDLIEEDHKFPDYVKRQLKPQKPVPTFKPQVCWLHDKLKINLKGNPNAMTDPGNKLKQAAQAHPNKPISIEGPINGTVVHAQYNTPVGLYSGSQIVSTLVGTAAARGANVPDPTAFGDSNTTVDTETAVYKMIHKNSKPHSSPAQSRSIQILDQILSHPEAAQRYANKK